MKVSAAKPFQIIYSLFQHEYLGYLFESFVVRLNDKGKLTLQHQNISSKNASDFSAGLDENDYKLIKLMDSMQQDNVVNQFSKIKQNANDFFQKIYHEGTGNKEVQKEIHNYLERRRSEILDLIAGKLLFEMGNDGEPAWKNVEIVNEKASVLFHFRVNDKNTHYFPTIKCGNKKVNFQYKGAYLVCKEPAWMIVDRKLYGFNDNLDGKKLTPFLNKNFIVIPRDLEETYYQKFVVPLVEQYKVYAKGFQIRIVEYEPTPVLTFSVFNSSSGKSLPLFGNGDGTENAQNEVIILFELSFRYGRFSFNNEGTHPAYVKMEKENGIYIFYKVKRNLKKEKGYKDVLLDLDLHLYGTRKSMDQLRAFSWLNRNLEYLEKNGFVINQSNANKKKYFLGTSSIVISINEKIDWFDVRAVVMFGDYEIPFIELHKLMLKNKYEIKLPNGEIAVIPEQWFKEYSELFAFMDEDEGKNLKLKKHHLALVKDLEAGELAKVSMNRKLNKLRNFDEIDDIPVPSEFNGTLRPYQKAGYNWLRFLNKYKFGGCLADDMGLGKTVQTLAMLQAEKERGETSASLLIMPTSLIYNWEMEAEKFTPGLKVLDYTGTFREKDVSRFQDYDLVLTSYGITRLDIDLLKQYYFNYVILDESQAIKNPASNIAHAVGELKSKHRLILTGTPLENSTMDLWSQMSFINPGLLGAQSFFTREFLKPIEKHADEQKTKKLFTIIKPFILRRNKTQVLDDLPDKVENIHYCTMTSMQKEKYEEVKNVYRNELLSHIDKHGLNKSHLLILQGLTKLRQLANHPIMIDPQYNGDSGKMEDVLHMLTNTMAEGHKILIFSQFVKHLSIFRKHIESQRIDFAYLDGSTKDRKEQVEKFQHDKDTRIFLISLKAGGLGLNLTEADYVFILDPWWNPAAEAQAIDRAHRIGQKNTVFTYKFITKNTVEEKILILQKQKLRLVGELIHTEEGAFKSLTREDIAALLD